MEKETKKRQYDEAHKRATMKYYSERGRISLTVTKEQKQQIEKAAADAGQSVNKFILSKVLGD